MIVSEKTMDALKSIGLNLYERKIWVALLSRGVSTAGELSEIAKIPRSRAYDVLESLADKGFVIIQNAKPLKYVAVDPKEALERAKKKIIKDAEELASKIDELKNSEVAKELENVYKKGIKVVEPGELSGVLKGKHNLHQQLESLFKQSKKYIAVVAPPEEIKEIHDNHGYLLKKLSSKGVDIKILTHDVPENIDELKKFAEVRKINREKVGRLYMVDGKHVIIGLTDTNTHPLQDSALWASSEHTSHIFEPMFENLWKNAEKLS